MSQSMWVVRTKEIDIRYVHFAVNKDSCSSPTCHWSIQKYSWALQTDREAVQSVESLANFHHIAHPSFSVRALS